MILAILSMIVGASAMLLAGLMAAAKQTENMENNLVQSHYEKGKDSAETKPRESNKPDSLRQFNLLRQIWPNTSFCITTRQWCYVNDGTAETDLNYSLYNHSTGQILHGDTFEQALQQAKQFPCTRKNHKPDKK